MLSVRVIPIMLVSDRRLVKTQRFRTPTYVGDPINVVRIYNEKEVDELFVADIGASREGRGPDLEFVRRIASEAFMPICYAGGVSTVEHAHALLRVGVEKIAINTAALLRSTSSEASPAATPSSPMPASGFVIATPSRSRKDSYEPAPARSSSTTSIVTAR
jgi:imidazole glycerol phosphate synthase subunit HisF